MVSIIRDGNLKQNVYNDDVTVETTTTIEVKSWFQKYWQWAIGFFIASLLPMLKKIFMKK